jgi:high frequency lysogenization protein
VSRHDDRDRAIALAGVVEGAALVAETARSGSVHPRDLQRALATLFTFDAESAEQAMGGLAAMKPALRQLRDQLAKPQDPDLTRYGISLLHHARVLLTRQDLLSTLRTGLEALRSEAAERPADDPQTIASLAELYTNTVSVIEPRILVRGNSEQLSRPDVANLVRTLLLCGIRAAVLWQQCGGSRWRLLFGRRGLIQACEALMARD